MTVQEAIEILQTFPPESKLRVFDVDTKQYDFPILINELGFVYIDPKGSGE